MADYPDDSSLVDAESERIALLNTLEMLNTDAEPVFDRITQLAADIFETPIASVTLLDGDRAWFKSCVGISFDEAPREHSFCAYSIQQHDPLIVPDMMKDARFMQNPYVLGPPHIRFYAGAPVESLEGHALGALCVIDTQPRQFSSRQARILKSLAGMVSREIQMREATTLSRRQLLRSSEQIAASEARFRTMFKRASVGIALVSPEGRWFNVNDSLCAIVGYSQEEMAQLTYRDITLEDDLDTAVKLVDQLTHGDIDQYQLEKRYRRKDGSTVWVNLLVTKQLDTKGNLEYYVCIVQDIQARKEAEDLLIALQSDLEKQVQDRTQDLQYANETLSYLIEQQAQSAQDLLMREVELSAILENTNDAYLSTDDTGVITAWNRKAEETFRWKREEAIGRRMDQLIIPPAIRETHREGLKSFLSSGDGEVLGKVLELPVVRKDGMLIPVEMRITAVDIENRRIFSAFLQDITQRKLEEERRERDAQEDALTGLSNRRAMYAFLQNKLKADLSSANPLQLLYLDLDRFKPVNDTLGHAAGDQVLMEVAYRLKKCLRDDDLVSRIGGDEFVIIANGLTTRVATEGLCRRLLEQIATPILIGEHEAAIGCSIGIVTAPQDSRRADELLRFADIALYEAKAAGRNTWQFYTEQMSTRLLIRRQIETDLKKALRRNEMRLEFQPRYDVKSGTIAGAEALVRWQHPVRGYLSPDHFISIAEETGLIVPLSDWVLRQACIEAGKWEKALFVSVNLSPVEFKRSDLVARIRKHLEETGLAPGRLELEITEGVMLDNANDALATMRQLKALGVRISMDDFGTGYSSLSYVHTYPFDGIKIDRSFISSLDDSSSGEAIIEAIVGLGRALSLTVTAEGVETERQLDLLARLKCNQAQGFYLGRPVQMKASGFF
ncbi:PAS domain S-box-containing protein/diguanylate cyclase (GGDEF)-like protein [Pseudomonas duriflava]|uniref:PAS domain S-box-containing protein/diguanylate cyclase (GGDEF)-like protein n=1 Tax=Pseudomonas duriflava TaxID=459528 RepID=A0A562QA94_9PSED|nr:EAL domain-containing protein [Pseudomonas duriflava]TWI53685.1 PAS domain S-box-containing protein/diguanylate cyclase (GGDEF)-like protein [Pseudomonas duriflava]